MYNYYQNYKKEQRYKFEYEIDGQVKTCYPKSEQKKNENLETCKQKGIKVIKVTKLYPFSTNKNQHNFELVRNRCLNTMHDMETGYINFDKDEYNRLQELKEKAQDFLSLELPIAWLDWNTYKEVKQIAEIAVNYRINTCIERGRLDLIQYC